MLMVQTAAAMQRVAGGWRRAGLPVGLVPTMGYLHEGHLSLVRRGREWVGRRGKVVVSIYVNPTQFAPHEDLKSYPRDLARDQRLCAGAGVDAVWVPSDREMYFGGRQDAASTLVVEEGLSLGLEGVSRPTHFRGVTTVVAKLFNVVQPQVAVFGAKDFQQAAVIRRMVRDLHFPLRVVVAPTVREADGLAMSSRNVYLSADERRQAAVLYAAIRWARRRVRARPGGIPTPVVSAELRGMIEAMPAARVDYVSFVDSRTLAPVSKVRRGVQVLLAVRVGTTRLIDNGRL